MPETKKVGVPPVPPESVSTVDLVQVEVERIKSLLNDRYQRTIEAARSTPNVWDHEELKVRALEQQEIYSLLFKK